jgi:transcriptional regulator with XRE-family HTH domain
MHDLIGQGVAAARRRKRWTQEEAAGQFRYHGLVTWRTGTVGQLEAGLRRPRLDEVVLICAALDCALDELLPDVDDEWIELGDGAEMTPEAIRAVLYGEVDASPTGSITAEMRFPGEDELVRRYAQGKREHDRIDALLDPVKQLARQRGIKVKAGDWLDAFKLPTDAERHAARRLKLHPSQVKFAARVLWHGDFTAERDSRIGDVGEIEPRSLQARRGLVTRTMLAELGDFLREAYDDQQPPAGDSDG